MYDVRTVNVKHAVGVDGEENAAHVGVDEVAVVAQPQVPEERGLVEVGELDHVLHPRLAEVLPDPDLGTKRRRMKIRLQFRAELHSPS